MSGVDSTNIGDNAIQKSNDTGPSHDELLAAIQEAVPEYGQSGESEGAT